MLDEREFFIRKAIGWVLRDTGQKASRPRLPVAQLEANYNVPTDTDGLTS
jgi:3-methyladenine DNA glycosylase AlkD